MTQLPEHIWNKIMLYNSHPVADILREYTDIYEKLTLSDLRDNRKQFRSFANYVRHVESEKIYKNSCDCCMLLWEDCQCWCSNCHEELSTCRYDCYDN